VSSEALIVGSIGSKDIFSGARSHLDPNVVMDHNNIDVGSLDATSDQRLQDSIERWPTEDRRYSQI